MIVALVSGWPEFTRSDELGGIRSELKSEGTCELRRTYTHPEANVVLSLVITDWMTNPKVRNVPYEWVITPGHELEKEAVPPPVGILIDERSVPKDFSLEIPRVAVELCDQSNRELLKGETCIRIEGFGPLEEGSFFIEFVHVGIESVGGAWAAYKATNVDGKWGVEATAVQRLPCEPKPLEPFSFGFPER